MATTTTSLSRRRRFTGVLTVGFLALAVAVLSARAEQAAGWELSIYAATPLAFWAGVVIAVVAAAVVTLTAPPDSASGRLALVLGPLAIVSVVALPVLRGYYFFGGGDALSYLGWARMIDRGQLEPLNLLYPGIESTALVLAEAADLPLRRTLMTIPTLFVIVFVIFVSLVARRIANGPLGLAAGAFAALLLLPINNVHTYLVPYPTTAAIFFVPVVLYALFRNVTDGGGLFSIDGERIVSPFSVLVVLAGIATVLYHPQVGANVLAILVSVLGVQLLARLADRWRGETTISEHRLTVVQTMIVGAFFLLWAPRFERATGTMAGIVEGLLGGQPPGDEIGSRGGSLAELGAGLPELFLKLFAVSTVLSLFAGLVMLAVVTRRLDYAPDRNALLAYLTAAFVPIFGLFAVFFVASFSEQPFRYVGFLMVFVTVFAAVAFSDGLPVQLPSLSRSTRTTLAVVVFALLVVPQMSMAFMSPHIYQPSSQVPETRMEGYETAFDQRDSEVWFAGLRGGPRRYVDAVYGTSGSDETPSGAVFEGKEEAIPFGTWGKAGTNVSEFYSRCRYVALTEADYDREVKLYEELRYGAGGFEQMDADPRIHRVQSNGNFRLYVVEPDGSTCTR